MEISHISLPQIEVQRSDGTLRADEPVSKSTSEFCGGVPMEPRVRVTIVNKLGPARSFSRSKRKYPKKLMVKTVISICDNM